MKKRYRGSYAWLTNSPIRTAILCNFSKPMTKSEIENNLRGIIDFGCRSNINMSHFLEKGILSCINPRQKTGKVYVLTDSGIKMARNLSRRLDLPWEYSAPEKNTELIGWLVVGKRRKVIFSNIINKGNVAFRDLPNDTVRSHKYRVLNDLHKKGLIKKSIENGISMFAPSKKGLDASKFME